MPSSADLALAGEHGEEQRAEPSVLGGEEQRHHRHRGVDRPVRRRPCVRARPRGRLRPCPAPSSAPRRHADRRAATRSPARRAAAGRGTSAPPRRSVTPQKRSVCSPSSTTRCQPCVLPALGDRAGEIDEMIEEGRRRPASGRTTAHPPPADDVVQLSHGRGSLGRAPSLSRSSAIVQPWTMSDPPFFAEIGENSPRPRPDRPSPASRLVVDVPALAVGLDDERLLVVAALDAEALGETPAPGPLLADRAGAGRGISSSSCLNASSAPADDEPRSDDDVLVRERHQPRW